ncbi:hypothetical protein [Alkalihalobacillus sp. LMS39]|uniref:hypothetical protein n=1 Tax=Alkalihalobacillus sp. LMS39 TaxID=2924032 RepID=UPI001FB24707|nr:hypothetical protein [Alkalihalobacillus sp. LMS39]UOE94772.1 hypothetical protein MM271_03755 [Alkalihalobacillus sp. LMS39]
MMNDEAQERTLELAYKTVCEFEKAKYERIYVDEHNQITYQVDKEQFLELEHHNEKDMDSSFFSPVKYPSYKNLFNQLYRRNFTRNVFAIQPELLKNEIGEDNLIGVIKQDEQLRRRYLKNVKEVDLDNDGVPDRIDIDDTRNSVQIVSDLSLVKSSTDKETERHNKRKDELARE